MSRPLARLLNGPAFFAPFERTAGGRLPRGAGENEIVVFYETPGPRLSTAVSLTAALVWVVYCGWNVRERFRFCRSRLSGHV